MLNYKIISSGSDGNAVIYFNEIMIDCGVSFKKLAPHKRSLKLVLLTHEHGDHLQENTILRLAQERPTLVFGVPSHLYDRVLKLGIKNLYKLDINKVYQLGVYTISPFKLYHNVANVGYRIQNGNYRLFHATDTYTLENITAKNYDAYFIEHNYKESDIYQAIEQKISNDEFAYEIKAIENHLSFEKAEEWLEKNASNKSLIVKLHTSSRYLESEKIQ